MFGLLKNLRGKTRALKGRSQRTGLTLNQLTSNRRENSGSSLSRVLLITFLLTSLIPLKACGFYSSRSFDFLSKPQYYRVKAGDSFSSIARSYGLTPKKFAMLNGFRGTSSSLKIGQVVYVGYGNSNASIKRGYSGTSSSSYRTQPASLNVPSRSQPQSNNSSGKSPLAWPVAKGKIVSKFGPRRGSFHDGLDFAAPSGTPIYAAHTGKVIYSNNKLRGYGNLIIIRGDDGYTTIYAHNRRNHVSVGKRVKRGQKIAEVGSTGRSSGPHLHFEVRAKDSKRRWVAVDPSPLLSSNPKSKPRFRVNEKLAPILAKVFK